MIKMSIFTSADGVDGVCIVGASTTTTAFITATIKVQVMVTGLDYDLDDLTVEKVKEAIEEECNLDYELGNWEVTDTEVVEDIDDRED